MSIARILSLVFALVIVALIIRVIAYFCGPCLAFAFGMGAGEEVADLLFSLNVTTLIFCIMPVVLLLFLLIHRLTWPTLSRLLYPVVSRKVITNRKGLVSVGSLCVLYAFNLSPVGIKDVLKLFS